jgi:16S rRNA pseudouridine516 synthase
VKLAKYVANLGYGSRREVERMIADGRVRHRDGRRLGITDDVAHDDVLVDGAPLDPAPGAVVMLHKPVGYVTSTREESRLVYDLLPPRFLARTPVIAPVGRLDRDTSGLLLLTDDGRLNHRITSPRTHLPKVYEVRLAADLRGDEGAVFASGTLRLAGDPDVLRPAVLHVLAPRHARVTLTEGRYHQVRRMFAAVGNHVESLHRSALGPLTLDALREGQWRVLAQHEVAALVP